MAEKAADDFFRLIETAVTSSVFGRPKGLPTYSMEKAMRLLATFDSARFVLDNLPRAQDFVTNKALRQSAVQFTPDDGLLLEFGVASGNSIRQLASLFPGRQVFGFDSFEGLPTDWTHVQRKGRFGSAGRPPDNLPDCVELVVGQFADVLPDFCAKHRDPIALLHVDSDIYESARDVFGYLGSRLVSGSVIIFDEYFNYPGWQHHEHRAFTEFVAEAGLTFQYLGFASSGQALLVQVADNPSIT